ncbi:DNA mismatch repair protein MSH6, partial [Ananas comosus]
NGRSPLLRKQSQITSFFASPTVNPSPNSNGDDNPSPTANPNPNPNPNSKPAPKLNPSPSRGKQKKTPLVVPPTSSSNPKTPSAAEKKAAYSTDAVGKRIRVFWPLDNAWYDGCVKSFDENSGKHLVQYDDGEEEAVELAKEKIEWVEEEQPRKLRRLKRLSASVKINGGKSDNDDGENGDDSTDDEDWGKSVGKEELEDDSEEVELDEEEEEEEEEEVIVSSRRRRSRNSSLPRKRKKIDVEKLECTKQISFNEGRERSSSKVKAKRTGSSTSVPMNNDLRGQVLDTIDSTLTGSAERFAKREAEKFRFLREGRKDAKGRRPGDVNYDPRTLYLPPEFLKSLSGGQGYRVLVVEQTETPEQLELRRKEMGSKDKVVKREICAMVTKGTLTEGESLLMNPDASYLMSITENYQANENQNEKDTIIGVCMVDVSTSKFIVGQFGDDSERHSLCSILSELRPVEVIKPSKLLSPETERVLKNNTRNPLFNDLIPNVEFWDAEKTIAEICKYYCQSNSDISTDIDNVRNDSVTLPLVLNELVSAGTGGSCALSALGGCLFYLRQAFLGDALLKCAEFDPLPCSGHDRTLQKPYMILDAAALENLEILENIKNGGPSGTLFAQLDHCITAFGKRLLKVWIARPLYDRKSILERQDAIAGFKGDGLASALEFRKVLSRLPDMERLVSRLFASCTESTLLHHLLTTGKGLPDISPVLDHFKDAFDWSEADCTGRIIPHEGCDVEYDAACYAIREIESSLSKHLKEQRKVLGDLSINYVTVGKDTFLLEVPESLRGAVPKNYELQSSKKGYFRYWTPKIKELLSELSQAEAEKESALKGILQRLIRQFTEHHSKWRQLVSTTAGTFPSFSLFLFVTSIIWFAQFLIGADVPAESFEFSPIDRIFVRMGARDHIIAGQSTFLVELMETASMLSSATKNSLVAIDELGRGTSTSDGQAIAASVLEHLVHHIQCRGLFSTHYHRLAAEYEKDDKVALYHMACQVGKGKGGVEEVTFLYRLTPGSCPKSYGVNVARLAGIPASVLRKAMEKSSGFESNYGKQRVGSNDKIDEVAVIKELLRIVEAWSHRENEALNKNLFHEVLQRARMLASRN